MIYSSAGILLTSHYGEEDSFRLAWTPQRHSRFEWVPKVTFGSYFNNRDHPWYIKLKSLLVGLQKQPMVIKNRIRDQYQKNSENSMQAFCTTYCTRVFRPQFVLANFTLVSSAFSGMYVMLRIITNWTQENKNVVRKYSFWHTTVQEYCQHN